jgi:hypothetical protein
LGITGITYTVAITVILIKIFRLNTVVQAVKNSIIIIIIIAGIAGSITFRIYL